MAGEYASSASCPIAQCSRRSNRQRVGNSFLFPPSLPPSFLKWHHHMSAWLEYLGTVGPLNGAVYHRTLSEALGALLLNLSLGIYFARSGNEERFVLWHFFQKNEFLSLCLYLVLMLLYCHFTLKDPYLFYLIDIAQAGLSKQMGLSLPGSEWFLPPRLLFPNQTVSPLAW